MSNNQELLRKLIDDDEIEDVELQKGGSPVIVIGLPVKKASLKKKRATRQGCPCWCKCIGITMLIFSLVLILSMFFAFTKLKYVVEELTVETDSPQKFPYVDMSEPELANVIDRVNSFVDGDTENLVLYQDEINGFIGHSDYLRGNFMITLHEDRVVEEFSLPMDVLGFDGRYFVGSDYLALDEGKNIVEMKMETEASHEEWFDGPLFLVQLQYLITKIKDDKGQNMLALFLEKGSFFGQLIPQEAINERGNLLEDLYNSDDDDVEKIMEVINSIEKVFIEEGKVVVNRPF